MPTRGRLQAHRRADPARHGDRIGCSASCPAAARILASFAVLHARKAHLREPEEFGKGAIEGVAGPEAANNAGAQTSFIPMLTLGIPANPVMALMIGAMIIQGIVPGPNVVTEQPALFWGIIASMWIGNLMLIVLNLPLIGLWVKLLTSPIMCCFRPSSCSAAIGVYSVNTNVFDLFLVAFFGSRRLPAFEAALRAGPAAARLRARSNARGTFASRDDPVAWRPDAFVTRPVSAIPAGHRSRGAGGCLPAGRQEETRGSLRRGGVRPDTRRQGQPRRHLPFRLLRRRSGASDPWLTRRCSSERC